MLGRAALLLSLAVVLPACGGGGGSPAAPPPVTVPPAPNAVVTATGAGALVVHPSAAAAISLALEMPLRIAETAGGAADWNFARLRMIRRGAEIERLELTANDIRAAGFGRVAASSNQVYTVIIRFNSDDFDDLELTLGFSDIKDGRQFTVTVDFESFTDVLISPIPRAAP
jgi:hypothetical protein